MKRLSLILGLLIFLTSANFGQELAATVKMNIEQLPNSSKDRIRGFDKVVEDYLNNNRFTTIPWESEDRINCTVDIFFNGGINNKYSAQVVITSQRPVYQSERVSLMLRIQDSEWSFFYEENQALYYNQTDFDPLTSFLDFYANLIIGYDLDSYEPLGGSRQFERAYEIAVLGASSGYSGGWELKSTSYNKRSFIDEISDAKFNKFRQLFFDYHYNGIDIYTQNKLKAQANMSFLFDHLYENINKLGTRSVLLRIFFEAKNGEIVDYLSDAPNAEELFQKLRVVDPAHLSKYDKVLEENL